MNTTLVRWGRRLRLLIVGCLAAVVSVGVPAPAHAAGVVGNGTAASCTEAALAQRIQSGAGLITFKCGPNPVTIVLTVRQEIQFNITMDGDNKITLSGGGSTYFFQVFAGRTFTLRDIILTRGRNSEAGALANFGTTNLVNTTIRNNTSPADGGAISNFGALTITDSVLASNIANRGGAIINEGGTISISRSQLLNNVALQDGGAIYSLGTGVTLNSVTITGNRATGPSSTGGGIAVAGGSLSATILMLRDNDAFDGGGLYTGPGVTANIRQAEIAGNSARYGGGIESGGTLTLRNSTLSGNQADQDGGGLWAVNSTAGLTNVTLKGNSAAQGGGINNNGGTVALKNTIVTNSPTGGNCFGAITSNGFNIASDATCNLNKASDKPSTNPLLGALANNGGPSRTHMPAANSPALDKGNTCPGPDQRGYTRVFGPACDIGAVERGSSPPAAP